MKYRKKPIVVEAFQFLEATKDQVLNWVTCTVESVTDSDGRPALKIATLEGDHLATLGDWVIKGVAGEFYPCKPSIFKATYDLVEDGA